MASFSGTRNTSVHHKTGENAVSMYEPYVMSPEPPHPHPSQQQQRASEETRLFMPKNKPFLYY